MAKILGDFEVEVECPGCGRSIDALVLVGLADKAPGLPKLIFNYDRAVQRFRAHMDRCEGFNG